MKFIVCILIFILMISSSVDDDLSDTSLIKQCIYNYITCLSASFDYLSDNVEVFAQIKNKPYERIYSTVMEDRTFVKHFVESGENLDQIIKNYNPDVNNDIDDFRQVTYKENPDIVSSDYQLKSGSYILVPKKNND